jgi:hypothetical protein
METKENLLQKLRARVSWLHEVVAWDKMGRPNLIDSDIHRDIVLELGGCDNLLEQVLKDYLDIIKKLNEPSHSTASSRTSPDGRGMAINDGRVNL